MSISVIDNIIKEHDASIKGGDNSIVTSVPQSLSPQQEREMLEAQAKLANTPIKTSVLVIGYFRFTHSMVLGAGTSTVSVQDGTGEDLTQADAPPVIQQESAHYSGREASVRRAKLMLDFNELTDIVVYPQIQEAIEKAFGKMGYKSTLEAISRMAHSLTRYADDKQTKYIGARERLIEQAAGNNYSPSPNNV